MIAQRLRVKVPATSANLGPGFDVLATALDLWLTLTVEHTGNFEVLTDLPLPKDRSNLAVRAFAEVLDPDRYRFRIDSQIPLSGGLGSSAAVTLAAVTAAQLFAAQWDPQLDPQPLASGLVDPLMVAARIEGHPDNAAAALYGGFTVSIPGTESSRRLCLAPPGLEAVLVVPDSAVATTEARAALLGEVPLADASFNVAMAFQLGLGLANGDLALITDSLKDRLHQPYRAALYPQSSQLLQQADSYGALGATISGAGPTVLIWVEQKHRQRVIEQLQPLVDGWANLIPAGFYSPANSDFALTVSAE